MSQMNKRHVYRWSPLQSAWRHFHHHSSLLLLIPSFLHPASPQPHPGDMAPSRERVSSEETSTCQKKFTSSPSCLPSPFCLPHLPCSLTGTHHSSFPLLPSSSRHLIQITELACVSFVWGSILPGRWTGGEEMDSHWGIYMCESMCVTVCLWDGGRERKGRERLKLFWEVKCQTNEVRRLLSVKPVWGLAFQATEWQGCS